MADSEVRYPSPIVFVVPLTPGYKRTRRIPIPSTGDGIAVGARAVIEAHGASYAAYVVESDGGLFVETLDDWGVDEGYAEVGIRKAIDGERGAGWLWSDETDEPREVMRAPASAPKNEDDAN